MKEELIHESHRSKVFLVTEEMGKDPVVLKVLNESFLSPRDIAQLYNETNVLEGLDFPVVRKVLGKTKTKNKHALKMEYFEGAILMHQMESLNFENRKIELIEKAPFKVIGKAASIARAIIS